MAAVCTYGGLTFQDNEVNLVTLTKTTRYSPRNRKLNSTHTIHCSGEFIYSSTASIVAAIASAENALKDDYRDFTYTVGGTPAHSLRNSSDCISGVKVIQKSFPKGTPEQLASVRTFNFTLQATYDSCEDDLVSWQESIEMIGTGGPKFFLVDTISGPIALYTAPFTAIQYVQSGMAVGYTGYPAPAGPIFTGLGGEFFDRRRISRSSARNMGSALRFYPIKWTYFYVQNPQGPTILPISQ